jgi:hypothetical protein
MGKRASAPATAAGAAKKRGRPRASPPAAAVAAGAEAAPAAAVAAAAPATQDVNETDRAGVNSEYFGEVQKWMQAVKSHEILGGIFESGNDVTALTLADGAVTAPIVFPDLKTRLGHIDVMDATETVGGPILVMSGSVLYSWFNLLANPTPGVMINMRDTDKFISKDFKANTLPTSLRKMAVALTNSSTYQSVKLHSIQFSSHHKRNNEKCNMLPSGNMLHI